MTMHDLANRRFLHGGEKSSSFTKMAIFPRELLDSKVRTSIIRISHPRISKFG